MGKRYSFLLIITLFFCFCTTLVLAQSAKAEIGSWKSLPHLKTPFQQKIYLHFDKPYYAAGERMWFRAYLRDANTFKEDTTYTPMYVELIDARDSIVSRLKLQNIGGTYSGSLLLRELIPEGVYRVRAYTNWMRNTSSDFFYHRAFFIGNSLSSQIKSNVQFKFENQKSGFAEINFVQNNRPFASKKISYYIQTDEPVKKKKSKKKAIKIHTTETSQNGNINIAFKPYKLKDKHPTITVFYKDSINDYKRSYVIPTANEFDVQLFPEGGEIVMGMTNCVAYKAIGANGLGIDVEGTLYDNEDKKLSDFKTTHLGMGKFCYYPDSEHRYYVVFKTAKGETRKINLPRSTPNGYALAAVQKYGKILVSIRSELGRMVNDSLTLMGHVRGRVFYREPIGGFTPSVLFDSKDIEPGVAHFVLLNKKNEAISERLLFIRQQRPASFLVDYYNPVNAKRDQVTCVFEVRGTDRKPLNNASFSVAIIDAGVVPSDSTGENIVSNLLLNTDIKGYIEKPGLYFDPKYENANEGLDLLMLTQAWRRFDINKAVKGELDLPEHDMERAFEISGQVNVGEADKPLKGIQVIAMAPKIGYINTTETDKEGFFFFKNLAFPENTQFTIQTRHKNGLKEKVNIVLDEQKLPEAFESIFPAEGVTPITDIYLQAANEKYFYENGTRSVYSKTRGLLAYTPEKPVEERFDPEYQYSDEEYVLEGTYLLDKDSTSLASLLKKIPALNGWNENLQPKTSSQNNSHEEIIIGPRFAVDGNIFSYNEVKNIDVKALESVQVLKSRFGTESKNPLNNSLIVLSFKGDNPLAESAEKQNTLTTLPQGYSSNVQFYVPKYEFRSVRENPLPDARTTIAWIPDIRTGATGKGMFTFRMADKLSVYRIELEGITEQGEPCVYQQQNMLFYKDAMQSIGY